MASISSEGSVDSQSPVMEQEDIAVLTHDVRNFKEALGKLRGTLNPDQEKLEPRRVVAHERLGEVLRILRSVLEKYPALQSPELLLSASTLIQHLKAYRFDDSKGDHKQFFELIDQLALAFSSRVSEYLMGDLDTNVLLTNMVPNKTKTCEHIHDDALESGENDSSYEKKEDIPEQLNEALLNLEQGVEFALNRAKVWAKYAKDILMYIEKRCHLEMEYTRNLNKLAQTVRPLINEETNLPFQSIYCTALDYDTENSNSSQATCSLLLGSKFLEPLSDRRTEHEKERRQLKEQWFREVGRMHDIVLSMRRARGFYIQCQREADHRQMDEDALIKASEAENSYKASVAEANEGHKRLYAVKNEILQKIRLLLADSDNILQSVTVAYFQLQHTLSTPASVQFQTLCESSRLYEPGSQYLEAVKRLPPPAAVTLQTPFTFERYYEGGKRLTDQERKSTDSIEGDDLFHGVGYVGYIPSHRHSQSKAAESHSFRKLKTPSRCRECDSYVYFQGLDCSECGLACHKKCLETLAIQCGHKRLPRKMTTFGVDLSQHLGETGTSVPNIVCKCVDEIEARGHLIKGIYRVSGVKSRVEKLCQAFENGAELVDLSDIHPNVIANVLKLYLRQLPEPLLTFRLYPEFVRIAKDYPTNSPADIKAAKEELKELVKKLSRQHYLTLGLLMLHLKRISNDAEVNNMPPSNLGIVFGPTLLRTAEGSASLSSLVDTIHQTRAIELLITHADEIFNPQEIVLARENSLKMLRSSTSNESSSLGRSFSFMDRKKPKDQDNTVYAPCDPSETNPGNTSDDEVPYFLSIDGPSKFKTSPQLSHAIPTPKIFKGSLKDYQGLEGVSLPSLGMRPVDEGDISHQKLRKTLSDTSKERSCQIESVSTNRGIVVKKTETEKVNVVSSSAEEWCDPEGIKSLPKVSEITKSKGCSNRAESSVDSDYSFESRTSSVESRSFRELDEASEVFLELPTGWSKKRSPIQNNGERRHILGSGDSPFSSLSHSLDESQGSDFADDIDHAIRRSMAHVHTSHSRTQVSSTSKQEMGDNIYIPMLQKQSHSQESSQMCSTKQTIHQCKSSINNSNVEEQEVVAVKTQCVGIQQTEEAANVKKAQQVVSSAVATMKMSSRQMGHCTQIKSSIIGSAEIDTKGKPKPLMLTHKEGSTALQVEKIINDDSDDYDDILES
ncbi:hypothetical protein R5R35_008846 [Gryllus longicercus]|uniref:Uncharacterized protein n=1 Tax=Gryllus longicercus TaxID=2509291 RepID=A0AAN9V8V5_9ORTH